MPKLAYLTRPCEREIVNGDAVVVREEGERLLFSVIDGLGHGRYAAEAARAAEQAVLACDADLDVQSVLEAMHKALYGTRGVAALVGKLEGDSLEGCSVGNVDMRIHGANVPIVLSPGVLGVRVRTYRVFRGTLPPGSRMIVHTDGISPRFSVRDLASLSPADACRALLESYGRAYDDASALVVDVE